VTTVSKEEGRVDLGADCGMPNVALLYHQLSDLLTGDQAVTIDASRVTRVDASIIQLLCSFIKAMVDADKAFCWGDVSDAFRDAVVQLGLQEAMGLPA